MILSDELQHTLLIDGVEYEINTSFRLWMKLPDLDDLSVLFKNDTPIVFGMMSTSAQEAIRDFYFAGKEPKEDEEAERCLDYVQDAEMIYAAFVQAYHIDLFDTDIHWHKFMALLVNVPEETMFGKVIRYRSYQGTDEQMLKLKEQFAIQEEITETEQAAGDYFESVFG